MSYLAIDIGKSLIRAAIVDGAHIFQSETEPSQLMEGGDALLQQAVRLGRRLLDGTERVSGAGVGITAFVESGNGRVITSGFIPEWRDGFDAPRYFTGKFGLPTVVENDVRAAALGEAVRGAGKGRSVVTYATLSTGFGVATVIDGTIYRGVHDLAGQIGFSQFPESDESINSWLSGSGLSGVTSRVLGEPVAPRELFEKARRGYPKASEIVEQSERTLAATLAWLQATFDPDALVLGGSIALYQPDYVKRAAARMKEYLGSPHRHILPEPEVKVAVLGPHSVLVGAAVLAAQRRS